MVQSHPEYELRYRPATAADLPELVAMVFDDVLGATRESAAPDAMRCYEAAFEAISAQTGNQILVAEDNTGVIGMLQLTFIPGLSFQGRTRAQIETVRVKASARGKGVGKQLFRRAIEMAEQAGCAIVQLTTDRQRADAIRFYESIGFQPTHIGMKLRITPSTRGAAGGENG
jgi:ribosomal protein S18 acetylase RimI-like enzyme